MSATRAKILEFPTAPIAEFTAALERYIDARIAIALGRSPAKSERLTPRALRIKHDRSFADVAARSGAAVNATTVRKVEMGRIKLPHEGTLAAIAMGIGCPKEEYCEAFAWALSTGKW